MPPNQWMIPQELETVICFVQKLLTKGCNTDEEIVSTVVQEAKRSTKKNVKNSTTQVTTIERA